jgi:hypothetical protein
MSHAEYVAKLDESQLTNLIEQATARREDIRQSGWVKLWQVSIGWANVAWFAEEDREAAVEFARNAVQEYAAKWPGKGVEMEVSLERFRPTDAADLLKPLRPATTGAGGQP